MYLKNSGEEINAKVIIAHYNENLDWCTNLKYPYQIISKQGIPTEIIPNKGNEASSYLYYIIEIYDNLSDYTIFIHGHRTDWHHTENIDERINNLEFKHRYYNINQINNKPMNITNLINFKESYDNSKDEILKIFNIVGIQNINPSEIQYRASAQFYVSTDLILRHSKEKYTELLNYLYNTKINSFWTGRFLNIFGILYLQIF
jgi:hypothetical protein